ncbi:MAG TPA: hypothetical protein VF624_15105 [Tepidisphaeraceae bacterium]|jgi:hypothetical protein
MALPAVLFLAELTVLRGRADYGSTDPSKFQRIWRIVFVDRVTSMEDIDSIVANPSFPAINEPLKGGDPRLCRGKAIATLDETGSELLVYADYETSTGGDWTTSPLTRKDEVGGDFAAESKAFDKDAAGAYVVNSAGQKFDPPPQRLSGMLKLRVSGNRATSTAIETWAGYLYPACSYNADALTIRGKAYGAKVLLMTGMSFTMQTENGVTFQRWDWQMAINPAGWDKMLVPNRGYQEFDASGFRNWKYILAGEPPARVSSPYPLDANGAALPTATSVPTDKEFSPYYAKDFSVFTWTAVA